MPQFNYTGRDKEGKMRVGKRFAATADVLGADLINEGIYPIEIIPNQERRSYWQKIQQFFQGETLHRQELAIFARQMQLLHTSGVPMISALKQLSSHTRSQRLGYAIQGIVEHVEKGESLATAMQYYPEAFSQLTIHIVQIGESTGHLSEAFGYIHEYLEFGVQTVKQVKAAFRYPLFVLFSIIFAIAILNIFVIPSFAKFYINLDVSLPWQTRVLIQSSNFIVHYGMYLLILLIASGYFIARYFRTPQGRYKLDKFILKIPVLGKLLRRIYLIRFTQSLAIILNSGIAITQGLALVKNVISNKFIGEQIAQMQEAIERGVSFTQAIMKIDLLSTMDVQIISVGEKNGELSSALNYISNFHGQEIAFDLKRMNEILGPLLIAAVAGLVLIMALGVYLPIWNMINLIHA